MLALTSVVFKSLFMRPVQRTQSRGVEVDCCATFSVVRVITHIRFWPLKGRLVGEQAKHAKNSSKSSPQAQPLPLAPLSGHTPQVRYPCTLNALLEDLASCQVSFTVHIALICSNAYKVTVYFYKKLAVGLIMGPSCKCPAAHQPHCHCITQQYVLLVTSALVRIATRAYVHCIQVLS